MRRVEPESEAEVSRFFRWREFLALLRDRTSAMITPWLPMT
jgi:hypothetical protein